MQLVARVLALSLVSVQLLAVFIHVYTDICIVRLSASAAAKRPVTKESVVRWYLGSTRRRIDGGRERNGKDEDGKRDAHDDPRVHTYCRRTYRCVCIDP